MISSLRCIAGNALVIYMVVWSRRMRTITNFFIANLALADFVIGTFYIPFHFQAALLQRWNLPHFMCALCPFFQNVSVNTSIFTLVAIAQDRYRAIVHPLRGKSSKKVTKVGRQRCQALPSTGMVFSFIRPLDLPSEVFGN